MASPFLLTRRREETESLYGRIPGIRPGIRAHYFYSHSISWNIITWLHPTAKDPGKCGQEMDVSHCAANLVKLIIIIITLIITNFLAWLSSLLFWNNIIVSSQMSLPPDCSINSYPLSIPNMELLSKIQVWSCHSPPNASFIPFCSSPLLRILSKPFQLPYDPVTPLPFGITSSHSPPCSWHSWLDTVETPVSRQIEFCPIVYILARKPNNNNKTK